MFGRKIETSTVDTCRHRSDSRREEGTETAACGLLKTLSGVQDERWCRVRRDACEECCRSLPSTLGRLNPTMASLLFDLAGRVVELGGVSGCTADQAEVLKTAALNDMDVVYSEEPDRETPEPARPALHWKSIPPPRRRRGPRIRSWAVGVTTAPRRRPTLERTLESVTQAGWETPHLFIDSAVELPDRFAHLPSTFRDVRLGAWPSYYLAMAELLMRQPSADALMIVQDDVLFPPGGNLREHLEETLWPGRRAGLVSLYASSVYTTPEPGWHAREGLWVWGALAFVFPHELAQVFLTDAEVFNHRRDPLGDGLKNIDLVIGSWALRRGVDIWHPTPSLTQHIGETSTLWRSSRAEGPRRADWFAGDSEEASR